MSLAGLHVQFQFRTVRPDEFVKIAQNVAQPLLSILMHNLDYGRSSITLRATSVKNAHCKQSPIVRIFAQSGHPDSET
jgi:hypothetical protein